MPRPSTRSKCWPVGRSQSEPEPRSMLERVAVRLGWSGVLVPEVALLGQCVAVVAEVDQREHRRRLDRGVGAITDYSVLDALGGLPEQVPVVAEVDEELERARTLGAVELGCKSITRVARRPCRIVGVLRCGGPWLRAIEQVSLFAPLAPRAVVLSARADSDGDDAAALEAASLGVGLVRTVGDAVEPVVEVYPAPVVARLGAGHWLTTEAIYAAWNDLPDSLDQ